jgi:uncharacterized membrane protein YhhN
VLPTLLGLTAAAAVVDWIAVARSDQRLERMAKPLTLALLLAAAAVGDAGPAKPWLLGALAFGLAGDIALLYAGDDALDRPFLLGLSAFLVGHIGYLVAFTRHGLEPRAVLAGVVITLAVATPALLQVLRGAAGSGGRTLATIVAGYATLLAATSVLGVGTASLATATGAVLFLGSDTTLAWQRFVRPVGGGPVLVMISYHLGQLLIVLGLLR